MLFSPYYLLFLPAIPDPSRIHEAQSFVHRKIMADFCHSSVEVNGIAPRCSNLQLPKTPIFMESLVGVWEFQLPAPPVLQLSTSYPQPTVDNSSGVWEF